MWENKYRKKIESLRAVLLDGSGSSDNEKEIARNILNKYEEKGIDINFDDLEDREFNCFSKYWSQLYMNILGKILWDKLNGRKLRWYVNWRKNYRIINLSDSEYIEIKSNVDFYYMRFKAQLKENNELFLSAFIHKNNIYFTGENNPSKDNETPREDIIKIAWLSNMIERSEHNKNLWYKN